MKDIKEYKSVDYTKVEVSDCDVLSEIVRYFKELGVTTLRIFSDKEGKNLSNEGFDYDEAYYNSPIIHLDYTDKNGRIESGLIYEVSITDCNEVVVCLYDEDNDYYIDNFKYIADDADVFECVTDNVAEIYDAVTITMMRREVEGYTYDYEKKTLLNV